MYVSLSVVIAGDVRTYRAAVVVRDALTRHARAHAESERARERERERESEKSARAWGGSW